eukprot:SAG31_NODE_2134_length_6367_cov_7.559190_1_plen_139_part_00
MQLFEKYGTLIERNTALIEKVSPLQAVSAARAAGFDVDAVTLDHQQDETARSEGLCSSGFLSSDGTGSHTSAEAAWQLIAKYALPDKDADNLRNHWKMMQERADGSAHRSGIECGQVSHNPLAPSSCVLKQVILPCLF